MHRSTIQSSSTRTAVRAATLIGLVVAPVQVLTSPATAGEAETVRERGVVIECTGTHRGREVRTTVYENSRNPSFRQVAIGEAVAGGDTTGDLWQAGRVDASTKVAGKRARITGTAVRTGPRTPVHEEHDDAGQHITVDGFHRALRTDLVLRYAGRTVDLTCDPAFFYDLQVTRESTTD